MKNSNLVVAANEIRDHPRTDEPGAPDYENAHSLIDTGTGLRVPPNFLVSDLPATSRLPSSAEEGWLRGKEKSREATLARADGVVLVNRMIFFDQHHPSRRYRVGFPLLG